MAGIQIGQLLIEQGALTPEQVEHVLMVQKLSHRPFGDLAERIYGIDPKVVEDAWVEQYVRTAGIIDLNEQRFDEDALRAINRRQAWQFHLLPMNRDQNNLNVATSMDALVRAVNFTARKLDEPIYFRLAEREQLREFLMKHYPVPQHIASYAATL
ncbi:MAG TPA: hypothetical protein VMD30_02130 [Tepidisphaeraceae bacterium]|nr:hypothetical protein [Tepidisphaeraceae bacterium]